MGERAGGARGRDVQGRAGSGARGLGRARLPRAAASQRAHVSSGKGLRCEAGQGTRNKPAAGDMRERTQDEAEGSKEAQGNHGIAAGTLARVGCRPHCPREGGLGTPGRAPARGSVTRARAHTYRMSRFVRVRAGLTEKQRYQLQVTPATVLRTPAVRYVTALLRLPARGGTHVSSRRHCRLRASRQPRQPSTQDLSVTS